MLCWMIRVVASLSMRIVGCSIAVTLTQNEPTSSVDHLVEFLFVLRQTLLRISRPSSDAHNFLLNGVLVHVHALALQIGYG